MSLVETVAAMIREGVGAAGSVEAAAAQFEKRMRESGAWGVFAAAVPEARAIVEAEFKPVEILHDHSITRNARPEWYHGPQEGDRHWPVLKAYLTDGKGWSGDAVRSIDDLSNEVVSLLENPEAEEFSCRGMVVGYVQSGKTANMTAVIAKAIDAGYDLVIVLAGLTNKLRQQTQRRMESDLLSRRPAGWRKLTTDDIHGDYEHTADQQLIPSQDHAQIVVTKKNVFPLAKLLKDIKSTPRVQLRRFRTLIIDDECDQATPNAAPKDMEMTAINALIREILGRLPAATYVGYTATPFANVFINPFPAGDGRPDDLYPKDFITSLPEPVGYFGAAQLFGRPTDDAEEENDGLAMIRSVPEEDEAALQPASSKEKDSFTPSMCGTLEAAMLHFLASCALRRARGHERQHMTMLVHTSMYVKLHESLAALIQTWIAQNKDDLGTATGDVSDRLREAWRRERFRVAPQEGAALDIEQELGTIFENMADVLDTLEIPVENGNSDDRIDYEGDAKTYIVVGGSVLARGLTLEGLMVSYFLRSANQYDTLLQMGRWFGYRFGYADLPRIWMPAALSAQFRALAGIEAEIREDIKVYKDQNITPMDFAVRVRAIPGMAITAAAKMKAAQRCDVSYWGRHVQTFRFDHRTGPSVAENWAATAELLSQIESLGMRDASVTKGALWRKVPKQAILRLLDRYKAHMDHESQFKRMLPEFIREAGGKLDAWNVGLLQPGNGRLSDKALGTLGPIRLMKRSRLEGLVKEGADLKAIMSRAEICFDSPSVEVSKKDSWEDLKRRRAAAGENGPMLLLYPIDGASRAKEGSEERVDLDAVGDLIGLGIVFPGSVANSGDYFAVQVDRSIDENEEDATAEALEALGAVQDD